MPYRILSLDGGGAWALIEVRALIALYGAQATGHQVLSDFDLVAANSGGSLVLGGLVENLALGDLRSYFEDEAKRRAVFSPSHKWLLRGMNSLMGFGPKYSTEDKLPAIQGLLPLTGQSLMTVAASGIGRPGRASVHLLIIGFDYDRNRAAFFRSAPAGTDGAWGQGAPSSATLAEAIHASTNAPVNFFDEPAQFPGESRRFWDGGITGCNNPVLAAVTEAITLGQNPADIVALSLGTGSVVLPQASPGAAASPYEAAQLESGLLADLKKLASSILDDPPDAASFIAHTMTGGGRGVTAPAVSRIVRMSPLVSPVKDSTGNWMAPGGMSADQFTTLCNITMDALAPEQINAIAAYAELWLADKAPNQPIRLDGATLQPEIGYATFGAALRAWKAIR
jgi:hypothetical protein